MCKSRAVHQSFRRSFLFLAGAGLFVLACGCNQGSSNDPETLPAVISEGENAPLDSAAAKAAGATGGADPGQAGSVVSKIEGDRLQVIPREIVLTKQTESSPFRFAEIAKEAGIDFVHFSGMTEAKHFPTANGSGVALFDFDNDGLIDLYFATATLLPLGTADKDPNRLYKNLGSDHFQDVTAKSGLGFRGFCHGIITGDIDNDGDQDVFLCNYGPNALFLNNGNGTFTDISKQAGIDAPNWSSGGAMLDYDNDGFLDIYVTNYGRWIYPEDHHPVGDKEHKVWLYSSPRTIKTVKHLFYHNNKNRTFTNVIDKVITSHEDVEDPATKAVTKVRRPKPRDDGHGFGVVAADVNNDGLIDLFVANDMNPNFLFLNLGDGTFDDVSDLSGAAFNLNGMAQSGMGVDAEDVDGDGLPELFVTNFSNETATLYHNYGKGIFYDEHGLLRPRGRLDALGQVGLRSRRFRQRRLAGLLLRQRPRRQQSPLDRPTGRLRGNPAPVPQHGAASDSDSQPVTSVPISTPSTSAAARPSATSTTTAISTSWSITRTRHRPCFATTRSRTITGSDSSSRAPRATETPSAPGWRSTPASGRSTASARGATAWKEPTTTGCW